jgi:hypothetical protein
MADVRFEVAAKAMARMLHAENPRGWSMAEIVDVGGWDAEPQLTRAEIECIAELEREGAFEVKAFELPIVADPNMPPGRYWIA